MCGCYLCAAHHLCATAQAVTLEAERDYAAGEAIAMDYGAGKLDSQVLLDHGVLDADNPQARPAAFCPLFTQLGPPWPVCTRCVAPLQ